MERNRHTLPKAERISNRKDVERLFAEGTAFLVFPLRVVYILRPDATDHPNVSILVNVPKRRFKKAVDRNRLKRLMKESYRLNKGILNDLPSLAGNQLQIAFLYIHQEILTYGEIEKSMKKVLEILKSKIV